MSPRVSAEHGEQVRSRILEATQRVMAERGLDDLTIADVVRESGLSVGAIYTWYRGKAELVAAACDAAVEREIADLVRRAAGADTLRERMRLAVEAWFDWLEQGAEMRFMVQLWAEAATTPALRETLRRRRERVVAVGTVLLTQGVAEGALPADTDVDGLVRGFTALLDGMIVQRIEDGEVWRRSRAEARAWAWMELLLAAGATRTG
jgi:AcrR family transcriptional regulator